MKILQKIYILLLLSTFSSAYAGDCLNDFDVADCKVKAKQGDAGAQYALGTIYDTGLGNSSKLQRSSKVV